MRARANSAPPCFVPRYVGYPPQQRKLPSTIHRLDKAFPSNPLQAPMLAANWKHRISDTAHCAVWTDNAILLNHQFPLQCSFHPARGALPVIGMNEFAPIIASCIAGPPPKTVIRRTEILEL